jgi:hypothetical protein
MSFVIKACVPDPRSRAWVFPAHKTMYGGKQIAVGDRVYLFASESGGGRGLVARGVVTAARVLPRPRGATRWTPRVSVAIRRTALAKRTLGRAELRTFASWKDGRGETELNFKFYRQATDKIAGVSDATAAFLDGCF